MIAGAGRDISFSGVVDGKWPVHLRSLLWVVLAELFGSPKEKDTKREEDQWE